MKILDIDRLKRQARRVSRETNESYERVLEQVARNHDYKCWGDLVREQKPKRAVWVPITPDGIVMVHLAATTEDAAWVKLLRDAPYPSVSTLKARGYLVERFVEQRK